MKLSKKNRSIQTTLLYTYFLILFSVFCVFMLHFVVSQSNKIHKDAFHSMQSHVAMVSSYVDDEIIILDTVAQNISYSALVNERFSMYLDSESQTTAEKPLQSYQKVENEKALIDILTAIIGPKQPVSQIYLYANSGQVFGTGHDTSSDTCDLTALPWYESFSSRDKYICCSPDERLDKYYSNRKDLSFLSLYIRYYNKYNVPQGVIEVKNPLTSLNEKIKDIENLYGEQIYIYDQDGTLVYPQDASGIPDYFSALSDTSADTTSDGIRQLSSPGHEYLFSLTSDYSRFTSIVCIHPRQLWLPIWKYLLANSLIFLVLLGISFIICYLMARTITRPIKKIYNQVKSFPDSIGNENILFPEINTYIIELNTLYSALISMQKQTIISMEREVSLHNQEMQSRMLALQSQMNPHFLYNSLATIQCMADEGMTEEIISMCQTISRILRYISSDKELLVPLENDLHHMMDYLLCMKIRYEEDLLYEIHVPDEMMQLKIPKLCLQLLVENAIKFTTKAVYPPWKITITGTLCETYWEISIQDNGPGFTEETLDTLRTTIDSINRTGLLPSLELNGMGLLNIYIRFKLLYRENHIFKAENSAEGGAIVTVGGFLPK